MKAVNISLGDLFAKDRAYCFLAGSGVSIAPPSCLPAGYQFTQSLLKQILPHEHIDVILGLTDPNRPDKKASGHFLRFEQLMGFLHESVDPELHVLDCLAESSRPNSNHLFLASLIERGFPVYTTNFDGLIEYALISHGIDRSQVAPVIERATWETERIEGFPVYKLHGSLMDVRSGEGTRSSIQATIEQVARNKPKDVFTLESWKMARLQRDLQERDLVVVGYSGLDDFDVIPALRRIPSGRRLIWISHDGAIPVESASVERPIVVGPTDGSTDAPSFPQLHHDPLVAIALGGKRDSYSLFQIRVDTRSLISFLTRHWSLPSIPDHATSTHATATVSAPSLPTLNVTEPQKWLLLGNIWHASGELERALAAYQTMVSNDGIRADHKLAALGLDKIGEILETQGKLDQALAHFREALRHDKEGEDAIGTALRLHSIGFILYGLGEFHESEQHFKQALSKFRQLRYKRGEANTLNCLANFLIAHEHTADALAYCNAALLIDKELGDISGEASRLTNIGFIHKTRGEFDLAMTYYQQALEIQDNIGNLSGKVILLNNIGNLHNVGGRYPEAIEFFERALELNKVVGDMNMTATTLANIGSVWARRGRPMEALRYYEESHAVFLRHGYEHQAYKVMLDIRALRSAVANGSGRFGII